MSAESSQNTAHTLEDTSWKTLYLLDDICLLPTILYKSSIPSQEHSCANE